MFFSQMAMSAAASGVAAICASYPATISRLLR
jgi:hypothetical protein